MANLLHLPAEMGIFIFRIIICTTTGSTAYNLSAGGSLVHSDVKSIMITPISPFSLSFRPIILPDDVVVMFKCPRSARNPAYVSIDGHSRFKLEKGEGVEVKSSLNQMTLFAKREDKAIVWLDRI